MKTKNLTPFPFGTKVTSRRARRPEMVLVLRAAYALVPGVGLALPGGTKLMAQGPLRADTYRDDDGDRAGECLYPGDFADWKPRAEVMLKGTCHTPFGRPLEECPVRFDVGRWSKILRIVGRRFWSDDRAGAQMSEAAPFTKMPVDYAHAFGGAGYLNNPVGRGFAGRELPNVEHAGSVIRARRDDPGRAGFGPINPAWPERAGKMGKEYGSRWQRERSPYYAEDFDWSHFNSAPADQQLESFLRGDEELLFQNLHPTEQVFETRLPGLRMRAFVKDVKARFREMPMSLDTLFADLDEGKLYLTWRGLDAIETDDQKDVQTVLVASEPLAEAQLHASHYRDLLEAFEADPLEVKSRVPAAMIDKLDEMKRREQLRKEGKPLSQHDAPPADPMSALIRAQMDMMPIAFAGGKELEAKVAAAVARMVAQAPPGVDVQGPMIKAANDASAKLAAPRAPAFHLRSGGPPPASAAKAMQQSFAATDRLKELAASGKLPKEQIAELEALDAKMEAMKKDPFFHAILNRPPYVEPGAGKNLHGQDYKGLDLRGVDLRAATLTDSNLAGANLAGVSLRGANLENAVLGGADLTGADFTGANLTLANLTGALGQGAIFRETTLDRAFLKQANLTGAAFGGAKGEFTFLPEANLTDADCKGLSLSRAFAKRAILRGADFSEASLVRCMFLESDGVRARFSRALLTRTSFAKSDLTGADFTAARGERSVWLHAKLHDADFTRAYLRSAQFMEASALRACFRHAILKEARCYRASFEHADFSEGQLYGIDFSKCLLTGASFRGACLYDAKFRQAAGERCDFLHANLKRAMLEAP